MFERYKRLRARLAPLQLPADGARLRSIGERIWVADRDLRLAGALRFPIRMVVAAASDGRLLCYSPVALDGDSLEALTGIGDVAWIVAPNRHHTLFAHACAQEFPHARVLATAPIEGCTAQVVEPGNAVEIAPGFEATLVDLRSGFRELVLYHDASETLIVSDMLFNIRGGSRTMEMLMRMNGAWGRAGPTRLQRLLVMTDPAGLDAFYQWSFARPFQQISMSHGQVISADARELFYQMFRR